MRSFKASLLSNLLRAAADEGSSSSSSRGTVEVVSKLVPKSIGNPKVAAAKDENDRTPHVLGVLGGTATKMVMRTMPNSDVFYGLGGEFFGVCYKDGNADPRKKRLQSGVMYLPAGIQDLIADQLRDPETGAVNEGVKVDFVFEVATVRATNPAGYSWSLTPLLSVSADDPMEALLSRAGLKLALPAPDAVSSAAAPDAEDSAEGKAPDAGAENKAAKAGKK